MKAPIPIAGTYPTGTAGVARKWDGHAWMIGLVGDPSAPPLSRWHRRPFAVLGHRLFWLWFGCWLVGIALALIYSATGSAVALQAAAVIAPAGTLWALLLFSRRRLHLSQAISPGAWIGWGLLAGVVASPLAVLLEVNWERLVGAPDSSWKTLVIAGPVEEACKLLIPVVLYLFGAYRDPRAGIALALASGLMFGWFEGWMYISRAPELAQQAAQTYMHQSQSGTLPISAGNEALVMVIQRPFVELMHPLLVMFVAALAWRAGWVRNHFWRVLVGAWVVAAAVHSINDVSTAFGWFAALGIAIQMLEYFVMVRPAARDSVPPDALALNPPRWRPRIPPWGEQLPATGLVGSQVAPT